MRRPGDSSWWPDPVKRGKTTLVQAALGRVAKPTRYVLVDEPPEGNLRLPPAVNSGRTSVERSSGVGSPDRDWIAAVWREARVDAMQSESGAVLAFDEIQKIPTGRSGTCQRL